MWDTVDGRPSRLGHDLPCLRCGHAAHTYLACSETCDCVPADLPGASLGGRVAAEAGASRALPRSTASAA